MALSKITNGGVAASGIPSGGVIQVKQTVLSTSYAMTDSYADITGFSVSITPLSTSSKFLVQVDLQGRITGTEGWGLRLYRDTTLIHDPTPDTGGPPYFLYLSIAGSTLHGSGAFSYLDSPNTTSAITYKIQGRKRASSGGTVEIPSPGTENNGSSSITVMEIAG